MSSHCSGRSLPECRTHVFQLNSRYPAGEMCFPELWPYATYPTSTYHIMFHLHRIWHCIKQSALNLNAYTSSHKTKPSCYEAMSLDAREFLVKLVLQAEKTRTKAVGRRRHYHWAVPSERNSAFAPRRLSWWLLRVDRAEHAARNSSRHAGATKLYKAWYVGVHHLGFL